MAKCICSGCKVTFSSESAFDKHRVGDFGGPVHESGRVVGFEKSQRRCLSVEEMLAKEMVQNDKGWWTSGVFDNSWLHATGEDTQTSQQEGTIFEENHYQ